GRPSRVVLIPRRWDQAFRATNLLGDGGYQARHSRESAKQPLKPSRRECRIAPALPVVTAACFFVAGGPWVRPASGIPRALFLRGLRFCRTRADRAARMWRCVILIATRWIAMTTRRPFEIKSRDRRVGKATTRAVDQRALAEA